MPLDIKTLKVKTLATSQEELYKPADLDPPDQKLSAIVQGMRLTNKGSADATVHLFFLRNGGSVSTDLRRLLPKNFVLPPGYSIVDEDQLTLGPGDAIYGYASVAATVDCILSGAERPA